IEVHLPVDHALDHAAQHIGAVRIGGIGLDLMSRAGKAQIHIAEATIIPHSEKAHGSPSCCTHGTGPLRKRSVSSFVSRVVQGDADWMFRNKTPLCSISAGS